MKSTSKHYLNARVRVNDARNRLGTIDAREQQNVVNSRTVGKIIPRCTFIY